MRRTIPLFIAAICGTVLIITNFIPATVSWGETASVWFDVLAAFAFVLGGGNLMKVHLQKISDREAGWAYSVITIVTFLLTLTVGLTKWGVPPAIDQEFPGRSFARLKLSEIPPELTYSVDVDLPAELFADELPSSVRRQLQWTVNNDRVTKLTFNGWINAQQTTDLLETHHILRWQSAVERLSQLAAVPAEMQGLVTYFPDHASLAVQGYLPQEVEQQLRRVSSAPAWVTAIDELADRSRRQTSVSLQYTPQMRSLPADLSQRIEMDGDNWRLSGPLSLEEKTALIDLLPRIRPLSPEQTEQFLADLQSNGANLTADQLKIARSHAKNIWKAETLISLLNEAGKSRPTPKSYSQLLAEQEQGIENLEWMRPATEPDIRLNESQVTALTMLLQDSERSLAELPELLAATGDWRPAQTAAFLRFYSQLPTIGEFRKTLFLLLNPEVERKLNPALTFLLAEYRREHYWKEEVHQLFIQSHQVKYPWSGGYLQDGSPFWWSYEYAFKPLTATMFALLAFYVASAAFRAFRAKNLEASLLLGTAFLVLLGRTYVGVALTSGLPDSLAFLRIENITIFVMSVINTAGNRAIMIGIALGIVSTSLKILLGVDRSYLGSD